MAIWDFPVINHNGRVDDEMPALEGSDGSISRM
jgi:hypothetical protein